jgi:hypothetical protein
MTLLSSCQSPWALRGSFRWWLCTSVFFWILIVKLVFWPENHRRNLIILISFVTFVPPFPQQSSWTAVRSIWNSCLEIVYYESIKRELKIRPTCDHRRLVGLSVTVWPDSSVYLKLDSISKFIFIRIKKKAKTEGKDCHTTTMWSQEKPI